VTARLALGPLEIVLAAVDQQPDVQGAVQAHALLDDVLAHEVTLVRVHPVIASPVGAKAALRVGIAWQGNPKHVQDRWRSAPLDQFAPLAAVPDVELISLQQGHGTEQISAPGRPFAIRRMAEGDLDGRMQPSSTLPRW
jgi:hypothetical protein